VQAEALIILVALFMGPTKELGEAYIFEALTFSEKESCEQYILENYHWLNIYLSKQWGTLPAVYASRFHCLSADEFKKYFNHESKEEISV
jgi:hypothetical protein